MTNTSATGGYLQPVPQFPTLVGNLSFTQFLQTVFVGMSGLPADLVRPDWQPNPPKQPDIFTNWLAIGLTVSRADDNAYTGTRAVTYAKGCIIVSCNPASGTTLTVNGVVITFGTDVAIGLTTIATTANLYAFLVGSSSSAIQMGTYSINPYFSNMVQIQAAASGPSGNSFTLVSGTKAITLSGTTLAGGGTNVNVLQRMEDLEVTCSFYGPQAMEYSAETRDSFQVTQNLESLGLVNMGFVSARDSIHMPELVNERWVDRYTMSVYLRREILRSYPVLSFVSASGIIHSVVEGGPKNIAWQSQ